MSVKIVTDSTSDLPDDLAKQLDITVVPLNVNFDDVVYKDGIDITEDAFYEKLITSVKLPTTSQPSVGDFLSVYQALSNDGHEIVSIHVSDKLSGTYNSATQAKEALPNSAQVHIIDSQQVSMSLGLIAQHAAEMVQAGDSYQQVIDGVNSCLPHTFVFALLDTLEYLQKGGRIGKAQAFFGSLLRVKPIITSKDGEVHPLERVRTRAQGIQKVQEIVRKLSTLRRLSIMHSTTLADAESLAQQFNDLLPIDDIIVSRFGSVLGTHAGPGALGVAVMSDY